MPAKHKHLLLLFQPVNKSRQKATPSCLLATVAVVYHNAEALQTVWWFSADDSAGWEWNIVEIRFKKCSEPQDSSLISTSRHIYKTSRCDYVLQDLFDHLQNILQNTEKPLIALGFLPLVSHATLSEKVQWNLPLCAARLCYSVTVVALCWHHSQPVLSNLNLHSVHLDVTMTPCERLIIRVPRVSGRAAVDLLFCLTFRVLCKLAVTLLHYIILYICFVQCGRLNINIWLSVPYSSWCWTLHQKIFDFCMNPFKYLF